MKRPIFKTILTAAATALTLISSNTHADTTVAVPTHNTTPPAPSATASLPPNPILYFNSPDPGVLRHNGTWYVTYTYPGGRATRSPNRFPIYSSTNLHQWKPAGWVFTPKEIPAWAQKSQNWWAPELHKIGNRFVAYYSTREDSTGRFVIGAAVADQPAGPYKDIGQPIVRTEGVGLIDVTWFQDPQTQRSYLIWKEDRNDFDPPQPTPIIMQETTPDGLALIGQPREILRNDQHWEGPLVEAPSLIRHHGWYYLLYSGNGYNSDYYAVAAARSRNIWGPYEKNPRPLLKGDKHFRGPGHQFVIQHENGTWYMFYHSWLHNLEQGQRYLMVDIMEFDNDGWPTINNGHPGRYNPEAPKHIHQYREQQKKQTPTP